ncbi:aspartyl/asparaginyl beta-hydroxylase domain-containing protein [Mucilaginibacter sp. X4EP1]|uniref:aspartyl/asparaginyl beta-hydroxylase domain-containing protein n=1 Tax=Mucilaginibacter sp. X4EP1 TaxID=2723092 RepID=UPI00216836B9|nr:aspartyl/asparaginyl beta-hydroxylase domain-containing protein [Mucilaginibacter sp. X4EP1]MCS3815831.1 quercetin dioxygenase-like cupin family protein [Mucilaginibacter sp. X4EP1]
MVRYAKLQLPFDPQATQAELLSVNQNWQSHFNTYHFEGSWTVLPLRSPNGDDKNITPELMGNNEYLDTMHLQNFPSVKKLLSSLQCEQMSVRFLNLQAGAVIKPHRDNELAFEKGEARLHFPILTNPEVEFYLDGDRIILAEGDCWYINANLTHNVSNKGINDRIHLVVDCKVNDWLKNIINTSTEISVKDDSDSEQLLLLIKELRLQNTETSNNIANELELQIK